jgi:diguanylate cyclase (GGDEF)-like protein/PAS domain S-box-containing protein
MSKLLKEKIRILFALIVMTLTLTVFTSGWVLYHLLDNLGQETTRGVQQVSALVDEQRQIQVAFKRQVQEWKDLLLRGSGGADFARYHDSFQAEAGMVQNKITHLIRELKRQGLHTEHLARVQQAHAALTHRYEAALVSHPLPGHPENVARIDAQVRGGDRSLSAEMDVLGDEIRDEVLERIRSVSGTVGSRYQGQQFYLYLMLLVMLPGAGYGGVYALNRLTRQLQEEKERVQVTLSSIGDAVIVTDHHGAVEYLNPVAEQMTGWSRGEAEGRPLQEVFRIINEYSREVVENPVDIVLREGRIVGLANHTVLIARDGSEAAIEDSAAPVRDMSDGIRGVVLVFHDATAARRTEGALRRQEALFRATFEQAAVGVAHVDPQNLSIVLANPRLLELLGYSMDELRRMTVADLTLPEDREVIGAAFQDLLQGRVEVVRSEKRCPRKDGSLGWSNISLSLIRKEDGTPDLLVAVFEDISGRKQIEDEAQALRMQYQTLFEQMPDAVLLLDLSGRVAGFNQEALRQYEYTPEEILRLSIPDLEARETLDEHLEHKRRIEETGRDDFETQHRTKFGRLIDVQAAVRLVTLPDGRQMFQVAFRDITAQKQAHHRIEFLANHDHLTSLPNRRLLRDRIDRAIGNAARHGDSVALLFLDLDHFKVVNDTLGHEIGDLLLQAVAQRLQSCVREQDSIARIGGDEFVVMLVELPNSEAAATVAGKIVDTLSQPYLVGGYDLHTSPSIGISLYPVDGNNFDALLQRADAAMYHAKENGRAGYRFFREEMNLRTQERLAIEHELHLALERGEFELYYQPKVDSRDQRLIGGEALIRWNHPERGMVPPGVFIPVAEQSNLINSLGEWVVQAVCRQTREWVDAGLACVPISFNVSARQFLYSDLPVTLARAVEESGADPRLLEMELTESVLMRPQDVHVTLAAIKALGFRVALDDFGTGYSSLAYLRKMSIDTIKIDRSFVNDLERSADDVVIVQTLISTALNLKMDVIAEGVETRGQADILCDSGCCACQGYFFGRPMPAAQFAKLLG